MNYCYEICELLEIIGSSEPLRPPPLATGLNLFPFPVHAERLVLRL